MAIDNPTLGKVTTTETAQVSRLNPLSNRDEMVNKINELVVKINQMSELLRQLKEEVEAIEP